MSLKDLASLTDVPLVLGLWVWMLLRMDKQDGRIDAIAAQVGAAPPPSRRRRRRLPPAALWCLMAVCGVGLAFVWWWWLAPESLR